MIIKLLNNQRGSTMTEGVLIAAFVAVVATAGVKLVGEEIGGSSSKKGIFGEAGDFYNTCSRSGEKGVFTCGGDGGVPPDAQAGGR